jgi:hypothetical protein
MADKKIKDTFIKVGAAIVGLATMENLAKAIRSEVGQEAAKKLYGNILNIGPNDEAIMDNPIGEISDDPKRRKEVRLMMDQFLEDMKENNYSTEWFKAVMVKKNKDWKLEMTGLSPVAKIILDIEQGANFKEKVKIATSELMHKTIKSKVKEGWHAVMSDDGEIKILIDAQKVKKAFSAMGNKVETAKEDFSEGMKSNAFWSWAIAGGFLLAVIIILKFI